MTKHSYSASSAHVLWSILTPYTFTHLSQSGFPMYSLINLVAIYSTFWFLCYQKKPIQNCSFNLACPPFSDSAFRHEATFCFSFLPYFFLSKNSQKFYLYCLQSAQYRNSRIMNLHSSDTNTHIVHVVPLPTYYSHIHVFSKLIRTPKLLQFLLLSLVRNIHAPESHSNLAPSRIYLHADNGWNFKANPSLPKTRKYCQGLLCGIAGTFFHTS
jgi:hypothetical protein